MFAGLSPTGFSHNGASPEFANYEFTPQTFPAYSNESLIVCPINAQGFRFPFRFLDSFGGSQKKREVQERSSKEKFPFDFRESLKFESIAIQT